jgi:hypothetical protein
MRSSPCERPAASATLSTNQEQESCIREEAGRRPTELAFSPGCAHPDEIFDCRYFQGCRGMLLNVGRQQSIHLAIGLIM